MLGFWNSASAISAAFFIDCAATPALPAADSGRINPTLTWPLPTASGCCGGPAGPAGAARTERIGKLAQALLHAGAGRQAGARRGSGRPRSAGSPAAEIWPRTEFGRRRLGIERAHHRISSLDRPQSARTSPPAEDQGGGFQAYCRRIVNQNKRIIPCGPGSRLQARISPDPLAAVPRTILWRKRRVLSRLAPCAQKPPSKYGSEAADGFRRPDIFDRPATS